MERVSFWRGDVPLLWPELDCPSDPASSAQGWKKANQSAASQGGRESWNPMMFCVGRDLRNHPVPQPCHRQGHLPMEQVFPSLTQPGLEHFQGTGIPG